MLDESRPSPPTLPQAQPDEPQREKRRYGDVRDDPAYGCVDWFVYGPIDATPQAPRSPEKHGRS